jgi:tetratricopeptide (TPR) repeat protein
LPQGAVSFSPASLLVAKHRVVPFNDIHGLRENFVAWAAGSPPHAMGRSALGRLVHGAGGLGKTRAMIEVADLLTSEHGWIAGFVPRGVRGAGEGPADDPFDRLILGGHDASGLLLVVDYAESRQDEVVWLADRLERRAQSVLRPARLVLLSRGAGAWWSELVRKSRSLQALLSLGGDRYDEIEIPERIAPVDRVNMFRVAVENFLALGSPPPLSAALARAIESNDDFDRPLALQMAALLHAYGIETGAGGHGVPHLLDRVLGLEHAHWDKTLGRDGIGNMSEAVKRGVAQLTLTNGVETREAAAALLAGDPFYLSARDIDVPRVRRALTFIFPGVGDGLAALEPELIGEHHVAEVADDALVDACLARAGQDGDKRRQILTVLNRATRPEHGKEARAAEARLSRLIEQRFGELGADLISVAVETPGRLVDLCAKLEVQVPGFDEAVLATIDNAIPINTLGLAPLALIIAERRAALAREGVTADDGTAGLDEQKRLYLLSELAARVGSLGIRLSNLGRREEALAASQEAVDIYRRLAETRPDAFLPDVAMSLNRLGIRLSNLGRREEALAASQEAVAIHRRLAETRPDAFLPDLASSLNNLGIRLSNLGRREEALAASQEAVAIHRRLAETRPDAFLPNLASSLNNLGNRLSNLGRREEALAASQEAVAIHRRLAETRPDAFLPNLASSLNNLGDRLSNLGRREEALAASQEAVAIYRRLAETRPDAFLPNLAMSLGALCRVLAAAEHHGEAAAVARQGLAAIMPFAEKHAATFGGLARALGQDYLAACEKAGTEPDMALVERVALAHGADDSSKDDGAENTGP